MSSSSSFRFQSAHGIDQLSEQHSDRVLPIDVSSGDVGVSLRLLSAIVASTVARPQNATIQMMHARFVKVLYGSPVRQ